MSKDAILIAVLGYEFNVNISCISCLLYLQADQNVKSLYEQSNHIGRDAVIRLHLSLRSGRILCVGQGI